MKVFKTVLSSFLVLVGASASAEQLKIESLDLERPRLVFKTADAGTVHHVYRVEATTCLVLRAWSCQRTVCGVGADVSVTNQVPMNGCSIFYRVVCTSNCAEFVDGSYMAIDISGGTNAVSYPVAYYQTHSNVPDGANSDTYKTDKILLRLIPKGTFTMGFRATDYPDATDSGLHQVTLTKDFYIGVFEVTQRQWELVMGNRPSFFTNAYAYASRPVEQVSYYDIRENSLNNDDPMVNWPVNNAVNATSFMGKLRAKTGLSTFDLPTESQWEYACRAGTTTALNTGSNLTSASNDPRMSEVGRYWYNGPAVSGYNSYVNALGGTAKSGTYLPNAWGLYDMHGNVWEWCLDWYGTYPGTMSDPMGPYSGAYRMVRGGSWSNVADLSRTAYRNYYFAHDRNIITGFRLVSVLP